MSADLIAAMSRVEALAKAPNVTVEEHADLIDVLAALNRARDALLPFAIKATKWEANHPVREGGHEFRDATQVQHRLGDFRRAREALK